MALALAVPGSTDATSLNEVKKLTASDAQADDRFGLGIAVSGDTAVVGAWREDAGGVLNAGAAYVLERDEGGAGSWGEVKKLTASDAEARDFFGQSVAVSGDTAVVGADREGGGDGAAYVFERNEGGPDNWGEVTKLTASDGGLDAFGSSVAVSGDTAVIGAPDEDAVAVNAGTAYVFERNEGGVNNWGEVKKLVASDAQAHDFFGISMAVSGDTAVAGAFGGTINATSNGGAAYIYQRNQGGLNNWGEVKKLTASDAGSRDDFGRSVAVSGDTAVMGAPGVLEAGAAYVFERNEGGAENWGEVTKLTASTALPRARFGIVTIRGDAVVVGAPGEASNSGAAYVYQRNQGGGDNWGEVAKLTASDGEAVDAFGRGVAVNADTAFVGASLEDAQGDDAGAAYVFDLLLPKSTPLPPPVGGMAHDSDLRPLPLEVASPGRSVWVMAAVGVAVASLVAGGGAAWYARARKPAEN